MHFFSNFASGRTIPTHSTGPQPIQLVPKHCFYRYLGNGGSNQKISKNKVHLFFNFATWRTLPTQLTGPQPIQLVPKHRFLQISQQRSLKSKKFKKRGAFIFEFCYWTDPPHPVNWSLTHSTGPQTPFFTDISVSVAQIKKIKKTRCILFQILLLGGPSPPRCRDLVENKKAWLSNPLGTNLTLVFLFSFIYFFLLIQFNPPLSKIPSSNHGHRHVITGSLFLIYRVETYL